MLFLVPENFRDGFFGEWLQGLLRKEFAMFRRSLFGFYLIFWSVLFAATAHAEDESVCAEAKIEIAQELTMERQAFEATMRIWNAVDGVARCVAVFRFSLERL